ncbi:MAG: Mut7-C ubiquitin [Peptococcaceae bacterium]|jgi:molybdopterin converting factor small subunit|nr:Mut7-C ubiquitin [Peptococcaceae bacterium]
MVTVEFSSSMMASFKLGTKVSVPFRKCTVRELLRDLEVDLREVGIVLINQETVTLDSEIKDNDCIFVLPMVCGG